MNYCIFILLLILPISVYSQLFLIKNDGMIVDVRPSIFYNISEYSYIKIDTCMNHTLYPNVKINYIDKINNVFIDFLFYPKKINGYNGSCKFILWEVEDTSYNCDTFGDDYVRNYCYIYYNVYTNNKKMIDVSSISLSYTYDYTEIVNTVYILSLINISIYTFIFIIYINTIGKKLTFTFILKLIYWGFIWWCGIFIIIGLNPFVKTIAPIYFTVNVIFICRSVLYIYKYRVFTETTNN